MGSVMPGGFISIDANNKGLVLSVGFIEAVASVSGPAVLWVNKVGMPPFDLVNTPFHTRNY